MRLSGSESERAVRAPRASWGREDGAPTSAVGSEARRALIATALGIATGLLVALFAKRDQTGGHDGPLVEIKGGRGWRGKSAT